MSRKYIRYFVRMKNRRVFQGPEVNKIFWMRLTAVTQIRPVSRLNMPLTFSVIGAIELCWFKRLGPVIIQRTSCETLLLWWKSSGKYFGYGTFGANNRRTVAEILFRNIDEMIIYMIYIIILVTLSDLFAYCKRQFSLKTIIMIFDQLITRLEQIHAKGFIHRWV